MPTQHLFGNTPFRYDPILPILNPKIKRRESFGPFAPTILREAVSDWFEQDDDVPFMMEVFQIRPNHRDLIPAVTHVDGSGRLQTVHKETSPRYYRLIEHFRALTGVPIVLNTSFNENEPLVCYPEEALDCFFAHPNGRAGPRKFLGREGTLRQGAGRATFENDC